MTTSIAQICNMAIGHVGGKKYVQTVFPAPEDSREARLCYAFYPTARDAVLEAADWKFASKTSTLALSGTAPDNWEYQYAWPAGCIMPRSIFLGAEPADPIAFEVGLSDDELTKYIWTDQEDARLRFTARVEDPTLYTPSCVEAISWRLGIDLSIPLKGNSKIQEAMQNGFLRAMGHATSNNANMGQARRRTKPRGSTSTMARNS